MNILFRADSSSSIGTGHIMRDLVLATQYPKADIIFATQELNGNINHKIIEAGYKVEILKSNDKEELDKLIKKLSIDMLIIDHYDIDEKQEKQLSHLNSQLSIMVLDDTYEKHHCDILLNHNISGDEKKYKGKVPKHCELRCGAKYTLLREEFIKEKKKINKKNPLTTKHHQLTTIFLAMGGADSYNLNIKILKKLNESRNIINLKVNIVTTMANENLKELKKYCKNKKWIDLHINSNKIAKLMRKSNIGIVTPSVIVNEIINLEIPFLSIKVTNNQLDMYKFLKRNKFYTLDIKNINNIIKYIKKVILNYNEEKLKIRKILK